MGVQILVAAVVAAAFIQAAFAQTQPTQRSAFPTYPTMTSAWPTLALNPCPRFGFNPTSPCYTGSLYPSYSAVTPFEFPKSNPKAGSPGSESLYEDEARSRIEGKGYLDVSKLEKDDRGIWRGKARLKDGRGVDVTLDLEGNIYSEPSSRLYIRIQSPPANK
jgi:hypothetical protein